MNIPILYQDETLLVINKPPGVVVNRAQSAKGETVQDWAADKFRIQNSPPKADQPLAEKFRIEDKDFFDRAGIVHRIDKETSGILLIAKTPQAFAALQLQFKQRLVKKTYLALVHGKLVPEEGEIRAPIGRLPWNREHFGILPGGKDAVTKYKVVKWEMGRGKLDKELGSGKNDLISHISPPHPSSHFSPLISMSLVELYPQTGRTHQIRVHLKYINHPILGDYLYAGRKTARDDRAWVERVMLHAWKITFSHPQTNKPLAIEAPIPDDMRSIITESTNDKSTNRQMNG